MIPNDFVLFSEDMCSTVKKIRLVYSTNEASLHASKRSCVLSSVQLIYAFESKLFQFFYFTCNHR